MHRAEYNERVMMLVGLKSVTRILFLVTPTFSQIGLVSTRPSSRIAFKLLLNNHFAISPSFHLFFYIKNNNSTVQYLVRTSVTVYDIIVNQWTNQEDAVGALISGNVIIDLIPKQSSRYVWKHYAQRLCYHDAPLPLD